jgi:hypothetical protein
MLAIINTILSICFVCFFDILFQYGELLIKLPTLGMKRADIRK